MSKTKVEETKVATTEEPVVATQEAEKTAEPIVEKRSTKKAPKTEPKAEEKPVENHITIKTVTATMLNVRKDPDVTSPVKTIIEKGAKIRVKAINDGWAELVSGGYVMVQYIE